MSVALHSRLQKTIDRLLEKHGVDIEVKAKSSAVYDPTTGQNTVTSKTYKLKCTPPTPFNKRYVDGDLIRAEDLQTYIKGDGLLFTPEQGMVVKAGSTAASKKVFGTKEYLAVTVGPYTDSEGTLLWSMQLRA